MLKIKNPFRKETDARIARRLESIKAAPATDLVTALEKMLSEDRQARLEREIGLVSFGRFAPRLRDAAR